MKLNLTKAAIDGLEFPESGKSFYYDSKLPGFGLYVTKTGKMYFAEGRAKGSPKKIRVTIGRHGQWMPDKAREEARALLVQMDRGENPNQRIRNEHTLKTAIAAYLEERTKGSGKKIKQTTKDGYQWLLDSPLQAWQERSVTEFHEEFIKTLHRRITEESGPACANNCLRLIRATFRYLDIAVAAHSIQILSKKRLWNPERRRTRHIEPEFVADWIRNAEKLNLVTRGAVLMMLFTGLRKMEVLALKKSQIQRGCIYLTNTKNSDDHVVPMGPYLRRRIEALMKLEGEWLFPSTKGEEGHIVDPRKAIASLGKQVSAHDLRRTFVSCLNALEPAPSAYTIKRLMNHRQEGQDVTAGYIQISEKQLREVMTRLEQSMVGTT